jgi:hypothetical protein
MDLTNLWQEHRIFILSVVAGLLLFIVGQAVISSTYALDEKTHRVSRLKMSLGKAETPSSQQLDEAQQLNESLEVRHGEALKKLGFVPNPKYQLSAKEKPDIQYDRLYNEARNSLVEGAKTLNITVASNLGMPELSPTRRSEIQRALIALDIVTRVVLVAIEANVGLIDSISMVPESGKKKKSFIKEQRVSFKMQGSMPALAEFLRLFSLQENFLAIEEARFKNLDKDGNQVRVEFTVAALFVIQEESET